MRKGGVIMGYKILVVDDEKDIVKMLKNFLLLRQYDVLTAYSGKEALRQVEKAPDLILLDVAMPDMDGLSVCQSIRDYVDCPIIFLTARIEDEDKIKGFSAGGDDYILKPFSLAELEARIMAHLRREERHNGQAKVRFASGLTIDYTSRSVAYEGRFIMLAKKEFDIVALLSQNAGQIFDKERIYERVWGWDCDGDSGVVAEHIRRIRAKCAKVGCQAPIETVWGCGYKWVK